MQIQEKSPVSVTYAKRQANAVTEKAADMIDRVATPVVEALASNRVGLCVSLMQRASAFFACSKGGISSLAQASYRSDLLHTHV